MDDEELAQIGRAPPVSSKVVSSARALGRSLARLGGFGSFSKE